MGQTDRLWVQPITDLPVRQRKSPMLAISAFKREEIITICVSCVIFNQGGGDFVRKPFYIPCLPGWPGGRGLYLWSKLMEVGATGIGGSILAEVGSSVVLALLKLPASWNNFPFRKQSSKLSSPLSYGQYLCYSADISNVVHWSLGLFLFGIPSSSPLNSGPIYC